MRRSERAQRLAVVAAARAWRGTPYHHDAAVKGAGVDCARFLLEAFVGAGLIERFTPEHYSSQWHLHRSREVYAETVVRFAAEIPAEPPFAAATVLLFRHGRTFSHSALVTAWPRVIHAYAAARQVEEVDITGTPLIERAMRAFDYWAAPNQSGR